MGAAYIFYFFLSAADTHGSDNGSQDLMINEHNCYFARHLTRIEAQGGFGAYARNRESLGSLLYHFFRFFARDFNYKDHVISIRLGAVLTKEKKDWTPRRNSRHDRYWWCIEDPFELTHNLGRVADRDRFVLACCSSIKKKQKKRKLKKIKKIKKRGGKGG